MSDNRERWRLIGDLTDFPESAPSPEPPVLIWQRHHEDYPSHDLTVSNPEFVRCGNAAKQGYTHWRLILDHEPADGGNLPETLTEETR